MSLTATQIISTSFSSLSFSTPIFPLPLTTTLPTSPKSPILFLSKSHPPFLLSKSQSSNMDTIVSGTTNLYRLPVPQHRTITSTSSTIYSSTWLASLPFNKLSLRSQNRRKLGLSIRTSSSSVRNLPITCVTEIGESQFPDVVLKSDRPVLVEFVASWCGPCRLMASAIDSLAQANQISGDEAYGAAILQTTPPSAQVGCLPVNVEYKEKMTVVKIDHDANPKLIEEFKVYGLPTLILFKNGKEVPESKREGALTLAKLKTYVDSLLDSVSVS